MAVKIRLTRRGRKKLAIFDVIVADARAPRDGRFIEKIGIYNPNSNPATIKIDDEKAFQWVMKGAQPTETVKAMLSYNGILFKKHLQIGVIKGALTQEQADAKFQEWKEKKEAKIAGKVEGLSQKKADVEKARREAEIKVNVARAEALRKKNQVVDEAPDEAIAAEETAAEETTSKATFADVTESEEKAVELPTTEEPASEEKTSKVKSADITESEETAIEATTVEEKETEETASKPTAAEKPEVEPDNTEDPKEKP